MNIDNINNQIFYTLIKKKTCYQAKQNGCESKTETEKCERNAFR